MLKLDKITKYYEVPETTIRRTVLDELSLEIAKGDRIAILGPSGSGKSTLLNVMSSLDLPNSGTVKFDGEEISNYGSDQLAQFRNKKIGFVFQSHHLLPQLSLLENVLLPYLPEKDKAVKKEAEKRALDLLDFVGLSNQIHQRPGQMSGGECQRAAVVRALIHQPKLILADEPTGSLDKESADQLAKLFVRINEEQAVTMIVVTHSQELAQYMNRICRIENGKIKEQNT
ncbi:ABC transporter ATP-binding protein [Ancylomarina euxinus]|uniref:ABC transporter ATP-binding protein n=1 Tax=Ancylomarina euxinus TaxID=2283627 RepID=A0A425Y0T7_9BACT|nr:ABC transporter ATP-binding protein [Ancylomarina euxinus]MCZ4693848.1 ABC transporter ATP-binding protein [Ancylomarina euxinus]MUP15073.1 ATP-binding cassette domain-containing protein [Ancylomarina euxinus]RRG21496.1 ABC transporter ATP-binding protein [Ancylomarina euxinus]